MDIRQKMARLERLKDSYINTNTYELDLKSFKNTAKNHFRNLLGDKLNYHIKSFNCRFGTSFIKDIIWWY